ncbi:MAG TPA: Na+/H+ antiporter [Roseiarcus sp.]|jgi:CPA1 family monovalent cation:H+ antiporter
MTETFQLLIVLLAVISAVALVAKRLKIPPAILLVITGVGLALIPDLPTLQLAPDLVLVLVLPPIIYWDAVKMSWKEFRFNLRAITLLAVGCVVFTTVTVAAATHFLLGFPWAVGFVLGAIISPPDAVAPLAIAERMQLPRRLLVILEGEGLANDATALVLYRFAVTAVSAGSFSFVEAAGTFVAILAGELVWGIGVGWIMLRLRRWVRDPGIEFMLSILTPFIAYWPPEQLGGSGVLATVAAGLYVSWNGSRLIPSRTRLPGVVFWDFLTYLIEGMVFLITGLQARAVIAGIHHYMTAQVAFAAAVVCAVVIAARFVWMFPGTYLPRWFVPAIRRKDPSPPWQHPFLLAFTGIRGIVSLAAAIAIPFTVADGSPFPDRDLILILTFSVLFVTLVGMGLTLPAVAWGLGLANAGRRERQAEREEEYKARRRAIMAAIDQIDALAKSGKLPQAVVEPMRAHHRNRLEDIERHNDGNERDKKLAELSDELELALIETERDLVNKLYLDDELKGDARRRIERELDLREALFANVHATE